MWVAAFQSNLQFVSSRGFLKMEVVCFFRAVSILHYILSFWKETVPMPFGLNGGHEMEGGQGLVLNNDFGRMISRINIYRNLISFSVYHNFTSAYTAISDTTGGHFVPIIY